MKFFKYSSLAAALMLTMGAAQAGSVEIYGTVDTGLLYTHESFDVKNSIDGKTHESSDHWGVASGTNTASVIGLRGTENISDNLSVGFVLENSFNSDDGTLAEEDTLFDKEAQLFITSSFGTLGLGRMGALTAGEGTYDIFMANGDAMDGGYADYIGAGYWMDRGIYDNTVTFQSPEFAGITAFAQYSFGTSGDDALPSRDKERYAALGATFTAGNFSAVAVVDTVMKNRQTVLGYDKDIDDAMAFSVGANYDMGFMKPFIGFQYGQHEQMIGGVPGIETEETETYVGDLDGYAVAVGSAFPIWGGELQVSVYYADGDGKAYWYENSIMDGESSEISKMDVKRYGVALFHNYELSKRTSLYAGVGYDYQEYDERIMNSTEKEHFEQDSIQVGIGLVHNF